MKSKNCTLTCFKFIVILVSVIIFTLLVSFMWNFEKGAYNEEGYNVLPLTFFSRLQGTYDRDISNFWKRLLIKET